MGCATVRDTARGGARPLTRGVIMDTGAIVGVALQIVFGGAAAIMVVGFVVLVVVSLLEWLRR